MIIRTSLAATAIATLALVGCGGSDSSSSGSTSTAAPTATQNAPAPDSGGASADAGATVDKVTIKDFKYDPPTITVKPGTKVTWTNEDSAPHTATVTGGFDTDTIKQGKSATVELPKAGTYMYHCAFHAYMHGTIVVKG
jgi:plastocyanin